MKIARVAVFPAVLAVLASTPQPTVNTQTSCEMLSSLSLPNATITMAENVPAGDFSVAPGRRANGVPAFCRVAVTLKPTTNSDVRMEVWLPTSTWNGKFQAAGTDAGSINYASGTDAVRSPGTVGLATPSGMFRALRGGYATSSTDAGQGGRTNFSHPDKVADYAYRAVHEMTVKAKTAIQAFYGRPPSFSYWNGCSNGGGQGVMEANRFPADYDGIIAGAPASPLDPGASASTLWLAARARRETSAAIPRSLYPSIHQAVVAACDASDGLRDGLIDDPRRCAFNPDALVCKGTETQACLTVAQVDTVKTFLSSMTNPRTDTTIYPPLEPGSELDWPRVAPADREPPASAVDAFRYVFLKDASWNWQTLDIDRDVALADKVIKAEKLNPLEPDLRAFIARGGKLLLYQGWSDAIIAPQSTINYYNKARALTGDAAMSNSVRLFMAPGMTHCGYGEGPNTFDGVGVLEQWVEQTKAPDQIIASHELPDGSVDRTRPLCPYPQVARYIGTGGTDDAANFVCKVP